MNTSHPAPGSPSIRRPFPTPMQAFEARCRANLGLAIAALDILLPPPRPTVVVDLKRACREYVREHRAICSEHAVLAAISRHRTETGRAATFRDVLARVPFHQIPEAPDALGRLMARGRVRRGQYARRCLVDTRDVRPARRTA